MSALFANKTTVVARNYKYGLLHQPAALLLLSTCLDELVSSCASATCYVSEMQWKAVCASSVS